MKIHRAIAKMLILCALGALVPASQAATLVQEFYLPMPEAQIYQANSAIIAGTSSTIFSTFSIVVAGNGTVIYYDQWEDGYEVGLGNPTQATTQIWGDGNDANGIPPGFAHDPVGLPAGTVITLTNNVALPRNPSTILWDARDRIASTKALVISRAAWPATTGPVFAGAASVLSTLDYGTNYISPVGQDLTNNLFKYVGLFVMAAQNNTMVTIDPNGNGVGTTNIVLNQGETYLVNGGVKKGGRITATKPVQADLIIGHVGASYASDWFTLYPVEAWSSSYYTPVGSAKSGNQPAYVYLYNPNTNAITINYTTQTGSGSFSVPASNGVFQFQMPVASGASFVSAGGQNFFALCTVAANNSADTPFNWGFTLVPKAALTTEAAVGWAPGSADLTVNGSPVWVTPLANTRIYVDYKGDHSGPLIDPNGNHYDTNFDLVALQSKTIYDPSKNQTGMRVYTVDGTLVTAAWGEDPDVAAPGNPYIDAGTTVLPFPVPVLHKSALIVTDAPPAGLSVGDIVEYTVQVDNKGLLPLGNTVVFDAPSTNLFYITNSTTRDGIAIPDDVSGTPFPLDTPGYTIPVILRAGTTTFKYRYQVVGAGVVSNTVDVGGTAITAETTLFPPPTNGASCALNFSSAAGATVASYVAGSNVFVSMTNAVANSSSNSIQTLSVTVNNLTHGDSETIVLTETGTNTGVFFNSGGLASSVSAGLGAQDGILNATAGDVLSVAYSDPNYGDSCGTTATVLAPAMTKVLYLSTNGSTNSVQALNRIDPVAAGHNPGAQTIPLSLGASASITVDAVSSGRTNGTVLTLSHPTGSGTNRLMLIGVATDNQTPVTSVKYNGTNLVSLGSATGQAPDRPRIEIFSLTAPTNGTLPVVVTLNAAANAVVGVATFTGVNQTTPLGTFVGANNNGSPSITVSSAANELIFDTVCGASGGSLSVGSGQTQLWNLQQNIFAGGSTKPGAASVTMSWTSGSKWAGGAIPIKPASGGGGTNYAIFTQTPVFCQSFVMPSNGAVTITNYVAITSGAMPANPNVTATLQYNGTNIITLTNAAYTSTNSTLVWNGSIGSAVTIPSGQTVTYSVTNNEPGVSFSVAYDSITNQSKISLPATTVIKVTGLAIYDAPYPGGNLVTTPLAGSTLYVRTVVNDPFGSYDITSVNLSITAPTTNANVNASLNNASVVASDSCSKTYEYVWQTGATVGGYNVAAMANEGTEGITDVAATSLSLIFLDLGTPSTTEFTSGNNGAATNSFAANGSACIRVTDLDQNANSSIVETLTAVVTSSSGDSELVTMTETGTNTGIFTACLNTSTNNGAGANNGLLLAPVGSVLTVSYTDPNDSSDHTSATATIQPPPGVPGLAANKTIVSPANAQAVVGETVQFNLQVINSGSTTLTNIALTDNFPSARLTFQSATVPPDTTTGSSLTWTNLATLTPGQTTNIGVFFTAIASGTASNSASANSGATAGSSFATVTNTQPALTITKILLSPTNTPVSITSNVVFRIVVKNTGNTAIPTLPMEDTFSAAYLQFTSATIPPDGSGAGSLIWTNLAGTPLAVNASITNDITMLVVGAGSPALNSVTVDFAVDANGKSVPAGSSTATNLVTASAGVSGYVYNDLNQSGIFTNGDAGLSSVTLSLYTDPNGDGNPADGALVQIATTDANGYYEFLNLTLGHYVAIQTPLPGYVGSAPPNNRLALNLTNLTTSVSNSFLQYQPSPVVYGNIGGTVYYDTNGNGTNDVGETGIANVTVDLVQDANTNDLADLGETIVATATTDTNGNYTFLNATPGNYVVRETDLFGYYSTGDSRPPNDNQIAIALTAGVTTNNNNFYDRSLPTAVNDTNSGPRNLPTIINPLLNDLNPNGDALTITNAVTTNGLVVINVGGTNLTYTPASLGAASITYTMTDGHGGSSTAVISVIVTNLPPVANNDSASTVVNVPVTISPLTNDSDPNSDALVIIIVNPTNGVAAIVNNTNVLFTPDTNFSGTATVGYTIDDGNGGTASAVITVNVSSLADVGIGKAAPAFVTATSNLNYTISVTNFGPSTASSVVVTDTLPISVSFVSASGGGVNNSGVVNWNLGALANGQVSNLTVVVTAPASGSLTNTASVSSPTSDPNSTNNVTPPVTTSVTTVADLGIGKAAPAFVTATSNLTYTISVTNFGPSTASSVVLTDALPASVSFVSASGGGVINSGVVNWSLGNLANGQVSNLTVVVTAPAGGSLTNTATVSSPTSDPNPTNNATPPVATTVTTVADLGIGKAAPAFVTATSNLTYTISVTNFGPSTAISVVVTDTLPAGLTFVNASGNGLNNSGVVNWSLGALANGQVSNLTVVVTAPASGSLTNTASVSSPTSDPSSTNNVTPPVATTVSTVADLGIGKAAPAFVTATSNLTYTISLTNFGPSVASSVVVTDTLPASVTFVSASGGGSNNSGVVNWSLGALANGQVSNLTVVVTVPATGSLTNTASVSSPTSDPNSTNNATPPVTTSVTPVADVGIGKAAPVFVAATSNLTYTISVTNFGPSTASNVVVTDALPASVSFVSASGGGVNNSGVVNWSLGSLANGQVSNLTVSVTAPASGSLTNMASVSSPTSDPNSTNNVTPPVSTSVTAGADVGIGKAAPAFVAATSNLTYTISVTNFGPSIASSVVVTDSLPAGVTFVSASGNGINDSGVVNWSLGSLASGQVSNLTIVVTAPASGSLTNIASVSSPTSDPNSTNNVTPPVTTSVTTVADLGIGKAAPAFVTATSNVIYTISVTNFGPSTAVSVVVTDALPAGVTFVSASGNSANNSGVVNWNLGDLANGQVSNLTLVATAPASGSLTNIASVSSPTSDPNSTNNVTPPVTTSVTPVADVGIGKAAAAAVLGGSNLTYTISVTNFGPSSASGVVVTDAFPAGVIFVSASGNGANNSGVVDWSLGSLASGQVSNLTIVVTAPATGSLTNTASVSSPTSDPNSTNNLTPPVITSVTPVNHPPVANNDNFTLGKNNPVTVSGPGVLANDTDLDGDPLTAVLVTGPTHGVLNLSTNGGFTYTPASNYFGADSFTYQANDGLANSGVATVSLTITNVNRAPVANNDTYSLGKNNPLTVTAPGVLGNDTDLDGDALTAAVVTGPTHGVLNLSTNGGFTYTPASNYFGADSFTYQANDGVANSGVATVSLTITNINRAPVANNDSFTLGKNSPLTVSAPGVLGNDTDLDGDPLTAAVVTGPTHGVLNLSTNGGFTYTPASNYFGADSFTYQANDGVANSGVATVSLTITNINHAPVANNDSYNLGKNTPLTVTAPGVLGNDTDLDGDALTAAVVTGPTHGVLNLSTNGGFTYTPTSNYFGADSFTYQANDGVANSGVATVSLTITNINRAPVANNDSFTLGKNTPLTVTAPGVLGNDADLDGDALTAAVVTGPAHGVLNLSTNGGFTYTPTSNYFGADSYTYQASDGVANSGVATVSLTITNINRAPVANNDSYNLGKNSPLTVTAPGVLGNDADLDGDALTAAVVTGPTHGVLNLSTNGGFTYTPTSNYFGADSFTYQANDGVANSGVATVSLTITNINRVPVANNDTYSLGKNSPLTVSAPGVLGNDTDLDGDALTAAVVTGPAHGVLNLSTNGGFTYTPTSNYFGADSFTYQANDGVANSGVATVSLTITNVNRAPVANNDTYNLGKNSPLTVTAPGVLGNDTDLDGDPLTAAVVTGPTHGVLNLSTNGGFTYTPTSNYFGADSFTYQANDGVANSGVATVSLTITNVNRAPVANNDTFTLGKNSPLTVSAPGVLGNDTDLDGDALTAAVVTGPTHGVLNLSTNGGFTYTPASNYFGADSFTYRANDGVANSGVATVSLTITNVNRAPVANNDSFTLGKNTPLTVTAPGVLGNDADLDGDALTAAVVTGPAHGVLNLSTNGGFTYTPASNYFGADSFTYQANDGVANSGVATVSLSITNVNRAPVANNDSFTLGKNTPLTVTAPGVLGNDTDLDGDALTAAVVTGPTHGVLNLITNGGFTYTPTSNYFGADSFTYQANDGVANSGVATVSLTITNINHAPVANNDSYTLGKNSPLTVTAPGVMGNDTDLDGDPLTAAVVTGPTHGVLNLSTNGGFTYTPASNYFGADSFAYQANDGVANSGVATVSLNITNVNHAPVANNDSYTLGKNSPLSVSGPGVLANDTDLDGNPLTAVLVAGPNHGILNLNTNGGFTYTPVSNYFGADSFTYQANDGLANSGVATVSLTITNINRAPVANNQSVTTAKNTPKAIVLTGSDLDGNTLTFATVSNPTNGALSGLNANTGAVTYTPNTNFTGNDSFTFRVNDGQINSALATVSISVSAVADVAVFKSGPTNGISSSNITFTITVTNMGPSTATNVLVRDQLPAGYVFVSAVPAPAAVSNNLVVWPSINLTNHARTNFTVTATSTNAGVFTNVAYSTSDTPDPNPTNNDGSSAGSQVSTTVVAPLFAILASTNVFNPQTGLFEQHVNVTNIGVGTIPAVRLLVGNIRSTNGVPRTNVFLYNATGTNSDPRPYVQYNGPLDPGEAVTFVLEFYVADRLPFTNSLEAQAVMPATSGTNAAAGVPVARTFSDFRIPGEMRFVIEFNSIPGRTYTILYSDDIMQTWHAATPSITASATYTQWYDDGPPKTASKPMSLISRYYRVVVAPAP